MSPTSPGKPGTPETPTSPTSPETTTSSTDLTTNPTGALAAVRRRFASVRAKATLGTTAVVAVALVAAGIAVLLSLRTNLTGQTDREADSAAREVALDIASQVPEKTSYAGLDLPDDEEHPVQVTDESGQAARGRQGSATDQRHRTVRGHAAEEPVPVPISVGERDRRVGRRRRHRRRQRRRQW